MPLDCNRLISASLAFGCRAPLNLLVKYVTRYGGHIDVLTVGDELSGAARDVSPVD